MTLFYAPRSPFAAKVRVCLAEMAGAKDEVEEVPADPWTDETLRALNPLCKVPTLRLDAAAGGGNLYGSSVIVQYLDARFDGKLVPTEGPTRWDALRREALGDGLAEAVIRRFVEGLDPDNARRDKVIARQEAAITAVLDHLDAEAAWTESALDLGAVAVGTALRYLTGRSPEITWQAERPRLAGWFGRFITRPSVATLGY
ncbi:glutathione S-transferase family protein [Methylobacterium nodulans]|nr:glutathione S-transferase N-terminal domain-containing protein [Methylobacterium nodulans]